MSILSQLTTEEIKWMIAILVVTAIVITGISKPYSDFDR
jgi:hypothetical protein